MSVGGENESGGKRERGEKECVKKEKQTIRS